MKLSEKQKDLLAFLPNEIRKSNELTDLTKVLLGNLIFLNGMDKAKENGYVYRTNEKLLEETEIGSKTTLMNAIALLSNNGYITTKRGQKGQASEYTLTDKCFDKNKVHFDKNKVHLVDDLEKRVQYLENQIVLLNLKIEQLTMMCTEKCTTDTEPD